MGTSMRTVGFFAVSLVADKVRRKHKETFLKWPSVAESEYHGLNALNRC